MWNVPVRFVVMWAPIVAVSIGGGLYMADCAQTLSSPGTGFTMEYPTANGSLKIDCKTYSFDAFQQTLIVERLEIHRNDGTLLARVPHLVVTGIVVDDGFAPKLQLKDAELRINRDAKGDLDILKLFEKKEGTSSQQPWQISVRDSVVYFTDNSVPGGAKDEISIDTGNFVGMGDNVEGGATLGIKGLIRGQLGFKKSESSTTIVGKKLSGKLAPILSRLRSGFENRYVQGVKPLQIGGGNASGDFTILISKGKSTFNSDVKFTVTNPKWDGYQADSLEFVGKISEKGLTGTAKIRKDKMIGDIVGTLKYEQKAIFGGRPVATWWA